jgi:uncharacterized protein YbjQ (UPF0145 family)
MRITFVALSLAFIGCGGATKSTRTPSWEGDAHDLGLPPGTPHVLIIPEDSCPSGHNCNILEVVDIHTHATSQDKGFDELRARAAELGADAVVGAEFEHGDGNEPSHLSGMIVRYGKPVPPHVDVGMLDIPSDENDENKGLAELSRRAHDMGGNQVIDVTFEHGEDGAQGHLRGKVIRYTE